MGISWCRLHADIVDDDKIRLLAFEDRWHYVSLLALKCQGILDEKNEDLKVRKMLIKLGLQPNDFQEMRRRLMEVGLIDGNMQPLAWKRRQFKSDVSTERVKKHRKNKKKETTKNSETFPKRFGNGPETETETETEAETEERGSRNFGTNEFSSVKKKAAAAAAKGVNEVQRGTSEKSRKTDTGANGKQNDTFQDSRLLNFERILRRYHQHLPDLHSVRSISIEREGLMDALVAGPLPNLGDWSDYFRRVQRSDFLMGRKVNGKKPFRASFNWLLRPEVVESVMEGKYDN